MPTARLARLNTFELASSRARHESEPDPNHYPENPMNDLNGIRPTRREVVAGGAMAAMAAGMATARSVAAESIPHSKGNNTVNFITSKDGTPIYYKDWGKGPVVTFSHGWPLNADAWDGQLLFLAQNGFRVIAHDRRGQGRSGQPASGNEMNTYADDLATLVDTLDLRGMTMVGHSTGGGEVARFIGRHGTQRVARAVLIAAVPPVMVKSAS